MNIYNRSTMLDHETKFQKLKEEYENLQIFHDKFTKNLDEYHHELEELHDIEDNNLFYNELIYEYENNKENSKLLMHLEFLILMNIGKNLYYNKEKNISLTNKVYLEILENVKNNNINIGDFLMEIYSYNDSNPNLRGIRIIEKILGKIDFNEDDFISIMSKSDLKNIY